MRSRFVIVNSSTIMCSEQVTLLKAEGTRICSLSVIKWLEDKQLFRKQFFNEVKVTRWVKS